MLSLLIAVFLADTHDGLAAWHKVDSVLTSPRCINCHTARTIRSRETTGIATLPMSFAAHKTKAWSLSIPRADPHPPSSHSHVIDVFDPSAESLSRSKDADLHPLGRINILTVAQPLTVPMRARASAEQRNRLIAQCQHRSRIRGGADGIASHPIEALRRE